jgi:hypothetical protein
VETGTTDSGTEESGALCGIFRGDNMGRSKKPRLRFQAKNAVFSEGEGARTLNLRIDRPASWFVSSCGVSTYNCQ